MNRTNLTLPGVEVVRIIGEGGHAVVVQVRYDGKDACAKVMLSTDAGSIERFRAEVRLLERRRGQKHIVDFYSGHLDNEPPYYLMEYCELGSLRSWVELRRPWQEVAWAVQCIAEALIPLHAKGGFHRDIKPDNVLWAVRERRRVVKLADFGIARDVADDVPRTETGIGTRAYLPPEVKPDSGFTSAGDVYALGVTALELLTGQREVFALAQADAPSALKALIHRMTRSDVAARPTVEEVAGELRVMVPAAARDALAQSTAPATPTLLTPAALTPMIAPRPLTPPGTQTPSPPSGSAPLVLPLAAERLVVSPVGLPAPSLRAKPSGRAGVGVVLALLAAGAVAAHEFLAGLNTWDPGTGRYRARNGRFRSGRMDRG